MPIQISNFQLLGRQPTGGFKHWAGLQPFSANSGDPHHASVRIFHVPVTNTTAIFRGDPVVYLGTGAADLYQNEFQFGGAPVGNPAFAPDVTRMAPGDTESIVVGAVVGWELTLAAAKNGQPYIPAGVEAWLHVETDPLAEFWITAGEASLPTGGWPAALGAGIDFDGNNAAYQSTRFGISGLAVNPATVATTATLPLRVLQAPIGVNDDVTDAPTGAPPNVVGNPIIRVGWNLTRHAFGSGGFA